MTIKEEINDNDYTFRGFRITRPLTQNHQIKGQLPGFDFVDYNSNKGVPCFHYQKILNACFNNFGYYTREFIENKDCSDVDHWFKQCVNNNDVLSLYKKYNPERVISNRESSPIVSIKDIL